jgi:hypothetical protein
MMKNIGLTASHRQVKVGLEAAIRSKIKFSRKKQT